MKTSYKILIIIALIGGVIILMNLVNFRFVNQSKPNLENSEFYKNYFQSDTLTLISIWSTNCVTCVQDLKKLDDYITENNLQSKIKFLSILTDNDSIKVKKFLNEHPFENIKNVTIENYNEKSQFLEVLGCDDHYEVSFLKIKLNRLPYFSFIKNGEVLKKFNNQTVTEVLYDSLMIK